MADVGAGYIPAVLKDLSWALDSASASGPRSVDVPSYSVDGQVLQDPRVGERIEYPVSSIQYPASSIQHRGLGWPAYRFFPWAGAVPTKAARR